MGGKQDEGSVELFRQSAAVKPLSTLQVIKKLGVKRLFDVFLIETKVFRVFLSNFMLTYSIRAGVSLLLRILKLVRKDVWKITSLTSILEEGNFKIREEAVRTGLLVGLFTAIYRGLSIGIGRINFLRYLMAYQEISNRKKKEKSLLRLKSHVKKEYWHSGVAGFVAGLSLLIMDKSWHRSLSLYMATRAVQSAYNYNKSRGYFHFWGSSWAHGDTLLFAVSSAQILYAYVMRPETLPPSYYNFILKQGPYNESQLQLARSSIRDNSVDPEQFLNYVSAEAGGNKQVLRRVLPFVLVANSKAILKSAIDVTDIGALLDTFQVRKRISLIPLQALHAYTTSTLLHTIRSFTKVAQFIFPVYLSLALVPAIVLRFGRFVNEPATVIFRSVLSASRSTTFLSLFCASYQGVVNIQRKIIEDRFLRKIESLTALEDVAKVHVSDHKFIYWFAGFVASGSLLLEKKNRRSELALYALPRAVDALYLLLLDRRLVLPVPCGELLLFCAAMGTIMHFYENHPSLLSPLLRKILSRLLESTVVFTEQEKLTHFDEKNPDSVSSLT